MNESRHPAGEPPPPAAGEPEAAATCSVDYVRQQIRQIERGLTKVLFGDYTAVVSLEGADPMWGNLAMHVNVVINAARNAISRAEKSEREAARARDRALAAASAESRFLTNVTHELRTPLASIRASAEILRDYGPGDRAVMDEFLAIMVSESERLSRLIENVLDLSRLQAGEAHWRPELAQVGDVVTEVVDSLRPLALRLGVQIRANIEAALPPTVLDRDGMKQVFVNLVSNALKFSASNEVIDVCARRGGDGDHIVVDVRDEGPGIPADQLELIFERFRQVVGDILTEKPSGTGLGLAIAKEIVDHHCGRISVASQVGVGTVFSVSLPVFDRVDDWSARQTTRRLRAGAAAAGSGSLIAP